MEWGGDERRGAVAAGGGAGSKRADPPHPPAHGCGLGSLVRQRPRACKAGGCCQRACQTPGGLEHAASAGTRLLPLRPFCRALPPAPHTLCHARRLLTHSSSRLRQATHINRPRIAPLPRPSLPWPGYIGSLSILQTVVRVAEKLRQYNPHLVYGGRGTADATGWRQLVAGSATAAGADAASCPVAPSLPAARAAVARPPLWSCHRAMGPAAPHRPFPSSSPQCATRLWGMMGGCTCSQTSPPHSGT